MAKILMKGAEAIAEAAIEAGCQAYFGYPITPQTEILEYMSWRMAEVGGQFIQTESEIAGVNMLFGAASCGARALTTSAGPGFSLKQEGISYLCGNDIPAVIADVMRIGSGLGDIFQGQGDYWQLTRGGGHGDYRTIVLAPASVQENADLAYMAFDLAEKYRTPVYLMADETIGHLRETVTIRELEPGEIVVVEEGRVRSIRDNCRGLSHMCIFEYIYFARPDSVIAGQSVHQARVNAGKLLAQEHPVEADVVIGVPDSGLDAALGYAEESGIPYGIGFIKNKYIGRTFIQGSQKQRENSVRIKLNAIASTVRGKRVVLIDDSIVRGTTSARIIKLLRDAGAKEVHFRVSAPPFKYPCYFGTDIPDQKLLVATGRTVDQINEIIGADTLGYLSTEHVVQLAKGAGCGFCTACFTGEYAVKPEVVLSTDIHERPLRERPKGEKKLGE